MLIAIQKTTVGIVQIKVEINMSHILWVGD
jgi:hypothetical protein